MKISILQIINHVNTWLFEIKEDKHIPRSRYHKIIEKLPLLMAMYGSSVLVAISTYNTFPSAMYLLALSVAIIGGASFDIILTSTVFSLRKNGFSYMTILSALMVGLLIALDLYLNLHLVWLHALYIVMATLFALHLFTTKGLNINELDKRLANAENTSSELQSNYSELSQNYSELQRTNSELSQTTIELKTKVENFNEAMIEKLATKTDLTANEIVAIIGGTRSTVLEKIRAYRNTVE
jgi:hypothetical protein